MKTNLLKYIIFAFFSAGTAHADEISTNLTLQVALRYGSENNTALLAAQFRWQSARENITLQKALPDPTLSYGYYFESVETRVGPQNHRVALSQQLPSFGKRSLKKSIATESAAALGEQVEQARLDLQTRIAKAYAELYVLKRSIDITQERIRLIEDLEHVTRSRYTTGDSIAATLQAQVELGRLEDRLSSLQDQRRPRTAQLNALLNRPEKQSLPWPSNMPYQPLTQTINSLTTNPELTELTHRIQQEHQQVQLAKRERYPDFTLGLQYIQTDDAARPTSDNGKDPIIGTVGITLPIWTGKNRARIQAAAHRKTAVEYQRSHRELTLGAELQNVLFSLRNADRKMNLYKQSLIPKAHQSLAVNRKAYEAGDAEFINLIDGERLLLEFELSYERALADHLIARAELSEISGINLLTGAPHETH